MKNKRIRALYLVEGTSDSCKSTGRKLGEWQAHGTLKWARHFAKEEFGDHIIRKFVPVGSQRAPRSASGPELKLQRFSPLTLTEFEAIADGLNMSLDSGREAFMHRFNRVTDPADETIGIRGVESVTEGPSEAAQPMTFDEFEMVAEGIDLSLVSGRKKFFKALGVFQAESILTECSERPTVYVVPGPRELYEAYERTLGDDILPWIKAGSESVKRYTRMSRLLQEGVGNKCAFMKTVPMGDAPTVKHRPLNFRELRAMAGERLTEGTPDTGWIRLVKALNKRFEHWANSLPSKDCGHVRACPLTVSELKVYAVPQFAYMESRHDTDVTNIEEEEASAWKELVDQINAHFENTASEGQPMPPKMTSISGEALRRLMRGLVLGTSSSQDEYNLVAERINWWFDSGFLPSPGIGETLQPHEKALDQRKPFTSASAYDFLSLSQNAWSLRNGAVHAFYEHAAKKMNALGLQATHEQHLSPWLKELGGLLNTVDAEPLSITAAVKALMKFCNDANQNRTVVSGEQLYDALCHVRIETQKAGEPAPSYDGKWIHLSTEQRRLLSAVASRQALVPASEAKPFESPRIFVKPGNYRAELILNGVSVVTSDLCIKDSDKIEVLIREPAKEARSTSKPTEMTFNQFGKAKKKRPTESTGRRRR